MHVTIYMDCLAVIYSATTGFLDVLIAVQRRRRCVSASSLKNVAPAEDECAAVMLPAVRKDAVENTDKVTLNK